MPNRLANETSPYLLQHKDNPVDWYPWGAEAFQKAKEDNKPVFLSVGYSSCHWCHVMEHESFEDEEIAKLLNESFVSVKVDREERPDVDETYMTAVQLSSGRGGWPMSVFLTPDKEPFFAGTYFPKEDRGQHPGFSTVLKQIAQGWQTRRYEFQKAAEEFAKALEQTLTKEAPGTFSKLDPKLIENCVATLAADFDGEYAGFGNAPKFPSHTAIELLMSFAASVEDEEKAGAALTMALGTLQQMALGGIHDHVGGGFHRYSTDRMWLLPHFEKMLYDNALLLANYARAARMILQIEPAVGRQFAEAAAGIIEWLDREMSAGEGFFYSALDADTEGEEGKFYTWSIAEVREVLGDRADEFVKAYGLTKEGNFLDEATKEATGANVLHLQEDTAGKFDQDLEKLLEARQSREKPGRDDKALLSWNGLMITALAEAGELERAEKAATALLAAEQAFGRLPHQVAKGKPSGDAFLDDYAAVALGLLTIAAVQEGAPEADRWFREGERLVRQMVELFYDDAKGGFYYTSGGHEVLFGRRLPAFDQPIPSPNSLAIRCLLRVGDRERAEKSINRFLGWMERVPQATEALHMAALELFMTQGMTIEAPQAPEKTAPLQADVRVEMPRRELQAESGKAEGTVVIHIPEGFHINSSNPPARWLIPTAVEVQPIKADVVWPTPENEQYEGTVTIPFTVHLPEGKSEAEFEVRVGWQACTESECLEPKEKRFDAIVFRS